MLSNRTNYLHYNGQRRASLANVATSLAHERMLTRRGLIMQEADSLVHRNNRLVFQICKTKNKKARRNKTI